MDSDDIANKTRVAEITRECKDEPKDAPTGALGSYMTALTKWSGVKRLQSASAHDETSRPWQPSLWRIGPISGIFSMVLAIATLFASLGILAGSNKSLVTSWSAPPSTYLAAFTAIGNLSIRYAAIHGALITWWSSALKGSSLTRLHYDWRAGTSLYGALLAGRRMGLIGLACLASTLVMVDGPLLQRASTTIIGPNHGSSFDVNVKMAPQIPIGYTGGWVWNTAFGSTEIMFSQSWNASIPMPGGSVSNEILLFTSSELDKHIEGTWWTTENLKDVIKGCPGRCKLTIAAPALLPTTCETKHVPMNYVGNYDFAKVRNFQMAPPLDSDGFMISSAIDIQGENERMILTTGSSMTEQGVHPKSRAHCNSTFTYNMCILEPAQAEYDVEVEGDEIRMDALGDPRLLTHVNYPVQNDSESASQGNSTLAAVVVDMWSKWDARVAFLAPSGMDPTSISSGIDTIDKYMRSEDAICVTYKDPRDLIVAELNRLMVYVGAFAAQAIDDGIVTLGADMDTRIHRTVQAQPSGQTNTYHTDYSYFIAAAILELVCVCLILPNYWGWWRIGRPVSFSPLEMAKAFESPLFANCNSNSSGRELAKAMEGTKVQYGSVAADEYSESSKISFGKQSESVTRPKVGETFDV